MNNGPTIFTLNERLDEIERVPEHIIIERYIRISGVLRDMLTNQRKKLFGIEGNIGTGKSTLANLLQSDIGVKAFLENVDGDLTWKEIIRVFYLDRIKHGFRTQLSLLPFRLQQTKSASEYPGSAVIDRTYWADQYVFVPTLVQDGLPRKELKILNNEYAKVHNLFPTIDLMFLLNCSPETSHRRIQQRSRGMETSTDLTSEIFDENHYLVKIGNLYKALPKTLFENGLFRGSWIEIDQDRFKVVSRAHTTVLYECIAECLDIKH